MFVKHKKRVWPKVLLGIFVCLSLVGSMGIFLTRHWYIAQLKPVSLSAAAQEVEIVSGSSPKDIGQLLESKGIIRSTRAFETYIRGAGNASKLKAGIYTLAGSMSTQDVVLVLVGGKESSTSFIIPPARRLDQLKKKFIESGYSEQEVDGAFDKSKYVDIRLIRELPESANLEGYVFPETFQVTKTESLDSIVRRSLLEIDALFTDEQRSKLANRGFGPHQAVILASIIERELPAVPDRKKAAQVFYSRIELGIPLGADATYLYAAAVEGSEPFPTNPSPYNTRKFSGLPPGPISNFNESALTAVFDPADTDYLFYVTGDDGTNHFTSTEQEHEAAVARYCTITCAAGYVPPEFR